MSGLLFVFFSAMLFVGGSLTICDAVTEEGYSRVQRVAYVGLGGVMFAAAAGLLIVFVWSRFT